jgi:hypothetical protein
VVGDLPVFPTIGRGCFNRSFSKTLDIMGKRLMGR